MTMCDWGKGKKLYNVFEAMTTELAARFNWEKSVSWEGPKDADFRGRYPRS